VRAWAYETSALIVCSDNPRLEDPAEGLLLFGRVSASIETLHLVADTRSDH
jgi:hypothetical protein